MPIINWGWSQVVARSEELQVSHVVSETKITWAIICCLPWRLVTESWIECRDRRKIQGIWLGCRHPSWWLNSLFHSTQLWNIKFCWDFKNIKRTVVKMLLRGWCHVPPPVGHFTWAPFGAPAAPFMIQLSACDQRNKWKMVQLLGALHLPGWCRGSFWPLTSDQLSSSCCGHLCNEHTRPFFYLCFSLCKSVSQFKIFPFFFLKMVLGSQHCI